MKKATIVFLWIAFASAIIGVLSNAGNFLLFLNEEGYFDLMSIIYVVVNAIGIWWNLATIKIVNNAICKRDITTGRKVAAFFFSSLIAAILLCCLKDQHFGYAPAPAAASTEEDAYAKLTKLKNLYESGAISEEEYLAEKAKILG
ncbi:MAG: SHOCT domain-containing protein [Clostridia bacterium]|nr:SHOCT domain-containing protein [Clostridia bacterium]